MESLTEFLDLFRKDMWNSFNALIVVLTIIDTLLCIFLMTDYTFARAFELHTVIYTMLYPYFIYPMVNIMLSASIYLTVVLGIERWVYLSKWIRVCAQATNHKTWQLGWVACPVIQANGRLTSEDEWKVRRSAILHFNKRQHPHWACQCTEVRFASLLSGGFTTMAVINPPERKLAKRISVKCMK